MAKQKPHISIASYGRYSTWNKTSKDMPKLIKYTTIIEAVEKNEFGIILKVEYLKSEVLDFIIKHPPIKDDQGNLLPQFKGKLYVNSNHAKFFVGDGIWLPVDDKIGKWEILIFHKGKQIISKVFTIAAKKILSEID